MSIQQSKSESQHLTFDNTLQTKSFIQKQSPKQTEETQQQHHQNILNQSEKNVEFQNHVVQVKAKQNQNIEHSEVQEIDKVQLTNRAQNMSQINRQLQFPPQLQVKQFRSELIISEEQRVSIQTEVQVFSKIIDQEVLCAQMPQKSFQNKIVQENKNQILENSNVLNQQESIFQVQNKEIQLEMIQQLQNMANEELRMRLNIFFPHSTKQFEELSQKQIHSFIKAFVQNYKNQQIEEIIQLNYPPRQQMLSICVGLLPELQDEIQSKNDDKLQQIFKQAMDGLKKQKNGRQFKFEYLEAHPFQIKTILKKPVHITLSHEDIVLLIDKALQAQSEELKQPNPTQTLIDEAIRDSRATTYTLTQQAGIKDQLLNQGSSLGSLLSQTQPRTQPESLFSQDRTDSVIQAQPGITIENDAQEVKQHINQEAKHSKVQNKQHENQTKELCNKYVQQFKVLVEESQSEEINKSEKQSTIVGQKEITTSNHHKNPEKRSFEKMLSSNSEKNNQKQNQNKIVNGEKTSKFNIPDLRQKLMQKLPQLKSSIVLLNDEEIEKIFMESIESSKVPFLKQKPIGSKTTMSNKANLKKGLSSKIQQLKTNAKSQIIASNKSQMQTPMAAGPAKKDLLKTKTKNATTQIVQFGTTANEAKGKKTRTIMLVHTQQSPIDQAISKYRINQNGETKKCNCNCCKKHCESIPSALKQFLKLLVDQ